MKTLLSTFVATMLLAGTALAADLVNVAGASHIALDGYDTVAFFTDSKPVHGSPDHQAVYQGATYLFASEEHRKAFAADPARYAPQFGGFCAYGAAVNALFPVDVSTWQIRDGKLYLNLNPDILQAFNADFDGNLSKARANWPGLVKKNTR